MIEIMLPMPYYKKNSMALMSMNVYRNMHHFLLNKFKKEYSAVCENQIKKNIKIEKINKLNIEYLIYFQNTKKGKIKKIDLVNIGSMVDKVFSDTLVKLNIIEDDSIEFIDNVSFKAIPSTENKIIVKLKIKD